MIGLVESAVGKFVEPDLAGNVPSFDKKVAS